MYGPCVLCDHREQSCVRGDDQERVYLDDRVSEVNCQKNLLLLRVSRTELQNKCTQPHLPIPRAENFPLKLQRAVMISWPSQRNRMAVVGHTSQQ